MESDSNTQKDVNNMDQKEIEKRVIEEIFDIQDSQEQLVNAKITGKRVSKLIKLTSNVSMTRDMENERKSITVKPEELPIKRTESFKPKEHTKRKSVKKSKSRVLTKQPTLEEKKRKILEDRKRINSKYTGISLRSIRERNDTGSNQNFKHTCLYSETELVTAIIDKVEQKDKVRDAKLVNKTSNADNINYEEEVTVNAQITPINLRRTELNPLDEIKEEKESNLFVSNIKNEQHNKQENQKEINTKECLEEEDCFYEEIEIVSGSRKKNNIVIRTDHIKADKVEKMARYMKYKLIN